MIDVEEVKLDCTIPDDGIGMVIMQPFVELSKEEPYIWIKEKRDKQIQRIIRTLEIAKHPVHGCEKTHFTIFPEYSIPGLEGIQSIQEFIQADDWKNETIIIGGVDGLDKRKYKTLCSEDNMSVNKKNRIENVLDGRWINCCIIWVKDANGVINKWVQPKLVPSANEELCPSYHMFEGKAVYLFKPYISIQSSKIPFRFLCFICKDWIGNIGGDSIINSVLAQLSRQRNGDNDRLDIYLCIVLKRNPNPDYSLFLQNTTQYLNENNYVLIRRSDGAVLFVNNAGGIKPGSYPNFGKSGFVFHPNCSFASEKEYCPPTYTLKKRAGLINCKEARFREDGPCIISFKFYPPIPLLARRTPASTRIPLNPAIVHSIDKISSRSEEDSRTLGEEIPASIKWVNDCLDSIEFLLIHCNSHPLRNEIENSHNKICKQIRKTNNEFLCNYITISSTEIDKIENKWISSNGRRIHNVDFWDQNEEEDLKTVVYSLSIIELYMPLKIKDSPAHATMETQDKIIDIIIVSGKNHNECFEYAKQKYKGSDQRFGIVITRDANNGPWDKKYSSIFITKNDNNEKEPNITDPDSRLSHFGYQNLINSCYKAKNLSELKNEFVDMIGL